MRVHAIVKKASAENYTSQSRVLIDTNIWVYVEDPTNGNDHGYSNLVFKQIPCSGATMYTTPIILEEYINLRIRLSYRRYMKRNHYSSKRFRFKQDYGSTKDFKENYSMILDEVQQDILPRVSVIDSTKGTIQAALNTRRSHDFNDEIIIHCVKQNGFQLLTHDRDFRKNAEDITILSNLDA